MYLNILTQDNQLQIISPDADVFKMFKQVLGASCPIHSLALVTDIKVFHNNNDHIEKLWCSFVRLHNMNVMAHIPLSIFRSNSKYGQNLQCSAFNRSQWNFAHVTTV